MSGREGCRRARRGGRGERPNGVGLLLLPLLCLAAGCGQLEEADNEYAATCGAALDCFLPCQGYAQCTACLEEHSPEPRGLIAAYDAIQCAYERCPIVCGFGAEPATCRPCMDGECEEMMAACRGWGSRAYDAGQVEPLATCYEIRSCLGECSPDAELCGQECYWDGAPRARLAFWKLWAVVHGSCADRCQAAPSRGCESCIETHAAPRGIAECLEPA